MMFIKDLQPRQTDVEVEGEVIEMSDVREFSKFGKQGRVANAMIKDGTGKVKLSLWNEQIEKVKVGDTVKIQKGYVGEYQGELQLTTGKFGTMEVVSAEDTAGTAPAAEETESAQPEETEQEEPVSPAPEQAPEPKKDPELDSQLDTHAEPETPAPAKKEAPEEPLDVEEEDVL